MSVNATKQIPMSFSVRPDQIDALDRLATEIERNRSYIVRRAIDLYLAVNAQPADIVSVRATDQEAAA